MRKKREIRSQVLKLRAELAGTSAQDEFSKWAKTRRKLDKAIAELEQSNQTSAASKALFAKSIKSFVWVATTAGPFIITSWHRKDAVFYLPPAWFGPATWWLGLPSAPMGAISCGLWTMACKRTFTVVKGIIIDLTVPEKQAAAEKQSVPVPVAVPAATTTTTDEKSGEKEPAVHKEL